MRNRKYNAIVKSFVSDYRRVPRSLSLRKEIYLFNRVSLSQSLRGTSLGI